MSNEFLEPFARLLGNISTPAAVRQAETEGASAAMWGSIVESGFLDAIVPEGEGGVGLTLADMAPILMACGEHLLPLPFGETMVARALLAQAGISGLPDVPIALGPVGEGQRPLSKVSAALAADLHVLVQHGDTFGLYPSKPVAADGFRIVGAVPDLDAVPVASFARAGSDLFAWGAVLTSAQMAGAMARMLDTSLAYVNDRQQFGHPLGKFQAIQHNMAVMAERVVAASVGARIGMGGSGLVIDRWRAAVAKCAANDAGVQCVAIAHAVHGAIGISEELDLQLYARRIKRWGLAFGSESYWSQVIGEMRAAEPGGTAVDFVRERMASAS